jgi:hypothetical protein
MGGCLELRPRLAQFLGQLQRDLVALQHHAERQPELGRFDAGLDTGQASILGRKRSDDRRLQEQNAEGPVIVLGQLLSLADRWLEVAALPCLEPVGLDAEAFGYAFGRVGASLLPDTPGPIAAAAGTNVRTEVAS